MNTITTTIKRPPLYLLLTEASRALSELGWFYASETKLTKNKQGDGHPVMVLPGFMASDKSTVLLRRFLKEIGYLPYAWELGRNTGSLDLLKGSIELLTKIHKETGQKVSIIGWSLGGVYARQVAKEQPEMVRQIITLGSPFAGIEQPNNATWLYNMIFKEKKNPKDLDRDLVKDLPKPTPVPSTAIYTKEDGIVSWKVCLEQDLNEIRQNIQVRSSHIGMGVNPIVLKIIADRLQYQRENWVKYEPSSLLQKMVFCPAF